MADKLPFQITPGTPNDDSVVHASDADESDLSRSHNERGISRLQGTSPAYSSSKTYNLNDLVEENGIVYRCSTAIGTPEVFDRSKWTVVWATENIVYIFEESDFPALISNAHPLEDGKLYVISASFTLDNPLTTPVGGTTGIVSFAKHQHKINVEASQGLINGPTLIRDILSFADSGGDLLITTDGNHFLSPGDLVNIDAATVSAYTQLKATVIATPQTDEFTIAGTFSVTDTGTIDLRVLNFTIDNLLISNPDVGFKIPFVIGLTVAERSFFEMRGTSTLDFGFGGILNGGSNVVFSDCLMNMESGPFSIDFAEIVTIYDCIFDNTFTGSAAINMTGAEFIQQYTIADCTFNTINVSSAILLSGTDLNSTGVYSIYNNVDTNLTHSTLFAVGGGTINETHPQVNVHDNVRQKNSLAAITVDFPFASGPLDTAVLANTLTAVSSTAWVENFAERFSLNTGAVTGEFTYNGLETAQFLISYHTELMPETDNQELFAGIFLNATEIPESRFTIVNAQISESTFVGHSFIVELETGDVLRFGVGNVGTAEDVYVANMATISVTKIT